MDSSTRSSPNRPSTQFPASRVDGHPNDRDDHRHHRHSPPTCRLPPPLLRGVRRRPRSRRAAPSATAAARAVKRPTFRHVYQSLAPINVCSHAANHDFCRPAACRFADTTLRARKSKPHSMRINAAFSTLHPSWIAPRKAPIIELVAGHEESLQRLVHIVKSFVIHVTDFHYLFNISAAKMQSMISSFVI